jgi:Cu(I)/Ag(I) efflux system membrane fusion protein
MKRLLLVAQLALVALLAAIAAEPMRDHAHVAKSAATYRCPMHPAVTSEKPAKCTICGMALVAASAANASAPTGLIALSPSVVTTIGVETSLVAQQPLTRTLRVNGTIDDDDSRHRFLTAWAEGRVEKLHANIVGAPLQAGAPLLELYSPELQTAQRDFVQLARAGALAAPALPAARARLRRLGLADSQLDELLKTGEPTLVTTLLAPYDGTIVAKFIYEGQWVKTGDKLLELADFSSMWFVFDAYEQDLPWLRVGQTVEITARSLPGEIITAPIAFIDPNLGEMTRTARIRAVLPNPHLNAAGESHRLFHRVRAEGRVLIESPAVLAAPRSSILDAGRGPLAYVETEPNHYLPRALKLGRRGDALVEILSGLAENDKVVTTGALLIDAQAQLTHAPAAAMHAHTSGPALSAQLSTLSSPTDLSALASAGIDAAAALAADDYARYQKLFPALAAAAEKFPALPKLVLGTNLKAARDSFEPWSTRAADLLKPHRAHLGLKVFECTMAPVVGKGRWVQRTTPIRNPFFGATMLECGEEVP